MTSEFGRKPFELRKDLRNARSASPDEVQDVEGLDNLGGVNTRVDTEKVGVLKYH